MFNYTLVLQVHYCMNVQILLSFSKTKRICFTIFCLVSILSDYNIVVGNILSFSVQIKMMQKYDYYN